MEKALAENHGGKKETAGRQTRWWSEKKSGEHLIFKRAVAIEFGGPLTLFGGNQRKKEERLEKRGKIGRFELKEEVKVGRRYTPIEKPSGNLGVLGGENRNITGILVEL